MDTAEKLWEIEQIKQLRGRALRLFDTRRFEEYVACFTEDCEVTIVGPAPEYTIRGRQELARLTTSMPEGTTVHQIHAPEIELIDASHARGIWAMTDYVLIPGFRNFVGYGHYHDDYEKGEDGSWRFRRYRLTRVRVDELGTGEESGAT